MNDNSGWIKLFRKFLNWEWYDDVNTKALFIHVLLLAQYAPAKWHGETLRRGELVTSLNELTQCGLSVREVRTSLEHLQKTGEIDKVATKQHTKIILLNYAKYQDIADPKIDECDTQATNDRQTGDTVPTDSRQSADTQATTYKNEKNDNNEENNRRGVKTLKTNDDTPAVITRIVNAWNEIPSIIKVQDSELTSERKNRLLALVNVYGADKVLDVIGSIAGSAFLLGKNRRGWVATFDWFIIQDNFIKVLEGNYRNPPPQRETGRKPTYDIDKIIESAKNDIVEFKLEGVSG